VASPQMKTPPAARQPSSAVALQGGRQGKGGKKPEEEAPGGDDAQFGDALEVGEGKGGKGQGHGGGGHDDRADVGGQAGLNGLQSAHAGLELFLVAQHHLDAVFDPQADQHDGEDHRKDVEVADCQGGKSE